MNNAKILEKAIKKAIKNGWRQKQNIWKEGLAINIITNKCSIISYFSIIFSHDFAKAFWGDECYYQDENQLFNDILCWQYHLQQMVLEKEPLKYLEKFL